MRDAPKYRLLLALFAPVLISSCNANSPTGAKVAPTPGKPAGTSAESSPPSANEPVVPPEIVQLKGVEIEGDVKSLVVGNAAGEYHLACNRKALGCESPSPGKNYLLFNNRTHWKRPGAQSYIDLAFIQNWTVTYNKAENVGLVPEDKSAGFRLGLYMMDSWSPAAR